MLDTSLHRLRLVVTGVEGQATQERTLPCSAEAWRAARGVQPEGTFDAPNFAVASGVRWTDPDGLDPGGLCGGAAP